MTPERSETPRFRFGPLERRGLVAGWRGGQIAAVAVALVLAVGLLRAAPSLLGALLALGIVAAGAAAATWPISGRTCEEWAPDAVRHGLQTAKTRRSSLRNPFATIRILEVDLESERPLPRPSCHSANRRFEFDESTSVTNGVGVVVDDTARTYAAVFTARGVGFVLLGEEEKARRVARWSAVLASIAREGSVVHRLQWIERSHPDEGSEVLRHFETRAVLGDSTEAGRSYRELLKRTTPVTHRHEVFLILSIQARGAARAIRAAGGGNSGACKVLLREAAALRHRLADADIEAGPPLRSDELARTMRRAYEASGETGSDFSESADRTNASSAWPWPMATSAEWSRLRADDTWHATFWVAEWPRTDVGPDFLGPLLLVSEVRRTVSVVMEPVGPLAAARQVEQARTADIADAELRRRGGFLATARRRREEEVLSNRELELADGHAQYRFTGYVTISASDGESLEEACGRVEQAACQAGLELRRCYGDQLRAFLCTFPLARGLA
ncbi:MAG TPA: SCO6880 family protein [Acidimicrobiales bacterium]|nr:SCO6880 family protein [Acidimicrobiales bacterium]